MCDYRLFEGDCLKILPRLIEEGVVVDCVLTDPPYGTTACKWDSIIPFKEMWKQLNNILKNQHIPILLFSQTHFSSQLINSNINNFKYDWIWNKKLVSGFLNANRMPLRQHEQILVFYEKLPIYNPQFTKGEPLHDRGKGNKTNNNCYGNFKVSNARSGATDKYPTSVLDFRKTHPSKSVHPTQKPVELLEYLIKTYTNKGDTVLDFTMGSGSTGVACANTGRQFIGIEIEHKYYKIAEKRIKEAYNQTRLI